MANKEYELDLSLNADSILDQLGRQGVVFIPPLIYEIDALDWYREYIGILHRDNLLTDNEAEKARKRLNQKLKGIINGK